MKRSCYVGELSEAFLDQEVTLMGWVHRRRDHGGVIFIDLRDREGLAQIVCDPDRAETFRTKAPSMTVSAAARWRYCAMSWKC